jgi:hypothetical protein
MTALQSENVPQQESPSKNPYNTRRKSIYFSPTTHSASVAEATPATTATESSQKHRVRDPEPNPRSPKRLRRFVHADRSLTPPPSPPTNSVAAPAPVSVADIDSDGYDHEDDPVINAIVHILQLSDNTPLSTRELSSSIVEHRLCPLDSPNPSSVVSSRITSHLKRRAAEKPPREPLLTRSESETVRKRTEYFLKYPDLVSDRSPLYACLRVKQSESQPLQILTDSKLNIMSSDVLDVLESDDYDSEDISNRSPDRPTLFDPPGGVVYSPEHQPYDNLSMMVDIDVPTGIKLDHEFDDPIHVIPLDNLTPPSDDVSYPNSPLREGGFPGDTSTMDESDGQSWSPSPPSADEEEAADQEFPHNGTADTQTELPSAFYDSPLVYRSVGISRILAEDIQMQLEPEPFEIPVSDIGMERSSTKLNEFETYWEESREGDVPTPEKVGMEELEEWLTDL